MSAINPQVFTDPSTGKEFVEVTNHPVRKLFSGIVDAIRFIIVIAFFGPIIIFSCGYGAMSKQARVLKIAETVAKKQVLDLDAVNATMPVDASMMAPTETHAFWSVKDWGDGGYEIQYLQAKSVRNYRAIVTLNNTFVSMKREISRVSGQKQPFPRGTFPQIEVGWTPVASIVATERTKERSNPWNEGRREFPNAQGPSTATLAATLRFLDDPRSPRSTFSPLRDHFLSSLPPASDPQASVHEYATKVLTDEIYWFKVCQRAHLNVPDSTLHASIHSVLQQEQQRYSAILAVARGASKAFRRE